MDRRRYLSTWLDWDCSKKGENPDTFLARTLQDYNTNEQTQPTEGLFKWTLGKQNHWGKIKNLSRTAGTIQKDWAIVKSYNLRESFCISVVGHQGWDNNPEASVPYTLVVSFEALDVEVPLYNLIQQEQQISVTIENPIEAEINIDEVRVQS